MRWMLDNVTEVKILRKSLYLCVTFACSGSALQKVSGPSLTALLLLMLCETRITVRSSRCHLFPRKAADEERCCFGTIESLLKILRFWSFLFFWLLRAVPLCGCCFRCHCRPVYFLLSLLGCWWIWWPQGKLVDLQAVRGRGRECSRHRCVQRIKALERERRGFGCSNNSTKNHKHQTVWHSFCTPQFSSPSLLLNLSEQTRQRTVWKGSPAALSENPKIGQQQCLLGRYMLMNIHTCKWDETVPQHCIERNPVSSMFPLNN